MKTRITALPKLFIGIDIHKRSWKIHCSTDLFAGKSFTMPPDPEKLREYVQKHFPDHQELPFRIPRDKKYKLLK